MNYQDKSGFPDNSKRPPAPPIFNAPRVVTWIIGTMVTVHVLLLILPFELRNGISSFLSFTPAWAIRGFPGSLPETLISTVTYQFIHADLMHLGMNCAWMLIFGTIVARRLELVSFIVFFLLCGVIGAGVHLVFFPGSLASVVGASGAISGLMGAAGRFALFPPQGGWQLSLHPGAGALVPLSDRRLQAYAGVWIVINLIFGLGSLGVSGPGQIIAWDIHIAGLIAGLLLFPKFDNWRRPKRPQDGKDSRSHLRQVK